MKWIDDVFKVYNDYFKLTFDKLELQKYEELDGIGMGALIKFKNDSYKLQIINDRGLLYIEISSLYENEQFRGIEMFYSLIELELDKNIIGIDKKKILRKRLDYFQQATFLLENSDKLKVLLNKKNYKETIKQIDLLGKERFDILF